MQREKVVTFRGGPHVLITREGTATSKAGQSLRMTVVVGARSVHLNLFGHEAIKLARALEAVAQDE